MALLDLHAAVAALAGTGQPKAFVAAMKAFSKAYNRADNAEQGAFHWNLAGAAPATYGEPL